MKIKYAIAFLTLVPVLSAAGVEDLLITEIVVTPTDAEFVEIYNNSGAIVDLTNVYITDATISNNQYYYNLPTGVNFGGAASSSSDFHARFPSGATIAPNTYITIAFNGSTAFSNQYGVQPTYEIFDDGDANIALAMLPVDTGSIVAGSGLSNAGEVVILYFWGGNTDLVEDIDYVLWGDKAELVDKTGIAIDGPDADTDASAYLNDTTFANQDVVFTGAHTFGKSWQRIDLTEGNENQTVGNGVSNASDETSEDLSNTFFEDDPTPNAASTPPTPVAPNIIINEVDAVGSAEFIEIKGNPGTSLNDVTLVLYQGSDNTNYNLIDLSGNNIGANGYFLIGDTTLSAPDVTLPANSLHDDASAMAIYFSNISNFTAGGALTTTDIIDAFVYDSGQADNSTLLTLLNAGQAQIDEDGNSAAATESNARCPDGGGGKLNTVTYIQVIPTAGTINNLCPITPYYATADPTNASTLRTTLHEIINDHTSFPYTNGSPNTWEILSFADEDHNTAVDLDNNVAEKIWMVYRNNSYTFSGGGIQAYNREHTWPKSRGFSNPTDNAPRTDAHHLMMSDVGYNSTRDNKYYDNCNPTLDNTCNNSSLQTDSYDGDGDGNNEGGNTGSTYPGNSNWTNGNVFEAWNFRKGDVARAMFYMDVRYEGLSGEVDSTNTPEPNLILTDDLGLISGSAPYMGKLSTLLQWHEQDPVDDIELERNEVIFSYQGNRNPFVDHPEWAACIFQDICTTDLIFANSFETP